MKATLTIRLDEQLATALRAESKQSGVSQGQIAREALEKRLLQGTRSTVMARHFGAMSGPEDLSTNKAYRREWKKPQK